MLKRYHPKKYWFFVGAILLIILLGNLFKAQVKDIFYTISAPIQTYLWQVTYKVENLTTSLFNTKLVKENELLKEQNQELLYKLAKLEFLEKENESLRKALDMGLDKDSKLILTDVSGGFMSDNILILNKGKRDGIKEDMPVISAQKVLYGFVKEVYDRHSILYLISHPKIEISVSLINLESTDENNKETSIEAQVKGNGNEAILDLVPKTYPLKEGSLVVTKSLADKYPKGLLVGLVKDIIEDDISPFNKARLELFSKKIPQNLFIISDF